MTQGVLVQFRKTLWSEPEFDRVREFPAGQTLEELIRPFNPPVEFNSYGGAFIKAHPDDPGMLVERSNWARVRPKPGMQIFVSLVPRGGGEGGGGGSGKQVFAIVAALALMVVTAGTSSFLTPLIGAFAANIAAGAVAIGGGLLLQTLTKPATGREAAPTAGGSSGGGVTIGSAGVSQNPIAPWSQVPAIKGFIRGSPPLLAKPYTTLDGNEQVLYMIAGFAGPCAIENIQINNTPIADFPTGTIEYETREGFEDDEDLTLITQCVFEENVNQELSKHRTEVNGATLVSPISASYPRPYFMKSAREAKDFRITLGFPSGFGSYDSSDDYKLAFRIRFRRIIDGVAGAWKTVPEIHMNFSTRSPLRQEIWFSWGKAVEDLALEESAQGVSSNFGNLYYSNGEWAAETYFRESGSGTVNTNTTHMYKFKDKLIVFMDETVWPRGQYEFEFTRSRIPGNGESFTSSSYGGGLFTVVSGSSINSQKDLLNNVVIQSYATFRDQYPIRRKGLALIALKIRNTQVQSLNAMFKSYVRVDGSPEYVLSNNPAHHFIDTMTGVLNARPVPDARIEDTQAWADHCITEGLSINRIIESGTTEDALINIAQCGDAILRRSDRYGVVVDKDRSAEANVGLVSPHIMTQPLTTTIKYLTSARGLLPSFNDELNGYSVTEFEIPVFDDNVVQSDESVIESVAYEGLTTRRLVTRRALRDLRASRIRNKRYSFGLDIRHIAFKKGDKLGLAHDVLYHSWGAGRIASYTTSGANLTSVTLNTDVEDVPAGPVVDNFFLVDNLFLLYNVFSITSGYGVGMQIERSDGSISTIRLSAVSGKVLTVAGTVATPANIGVGNLVNIGPTGRESRAVIVTDIQPSSSMTASIECVDLGEEIFRNLVAA